MESEFSAMRGSVEGRIRKSRHNPETEKGIVWLIDYLEPGRRSDDWSPRGTVYERDGQFFFGDTAFSHPQLALEYRMNQL